MASARARRVTRNMGFLGNVFQDIQPVGPAVLEQSVQPTVDALGSSRFDGGMSIDYFHGAGGTTSHVIGTVPASKVWCLQGISVFCDSLVSGNARLEAVTQPGGIKRYLWLSGHSYTSYLIYIPAIWTPCPPVYIPPGTVLTVQCPAATGSYYFESVLWYFALPVGEKLGVP